MSGTGRGGAKGEGMRGNCADTTAAGECKDVMVSYLSCMKKVKGMNDPECREFAKAYLTCRMDKYVLLPLLVLF